MNLSKLLRDIAKSTAPDHQPFALDITVGDTRALVEEADDLVRVQQEVIYTRLLADPNVSASPAAQAVVRQAALRMSASPGGAAPMVPEPQIQGLFASMMTVRGIMKDVAGSTFDNSALALAFGRSGAAFREVAVSVPEGAGCGPVTIEMGRLVASCMRLAETCRNYLSDLPDDQKPEYAYPSVLAFTSAITLVADIVVAFGGEPAAVINATARVIVGVRKAQN